jgi:hypothetical protein
MRRVLRVKLRGDVARDARVRARVLGHLARERRERVGVRARDVVPALDRLEVEHHRLAGARVRPLPRSERGDALLKLAVLGRRREQRRDDRKSQSSPTHARWRALRFAHGRLLPELIGASLRATSSRFALYAAQRICDQTIFCANLIVP